MAIKNKLVWVMTPKGYWASGHFNTPEGYGIYKYTVNKDGTINVDAQNNSVFLDRITRMPFKFGTVKGNFNFEEVDNCLESLEGSPRYVEGNFIGNIRKGISLKGSPEIVTGSYILYVGSLSEDEEFELNTADVKGSIINIKGIGKNIPRIILDKKIVIPGFEDYCKTLSGLSEETLKLLTLEQVYAIAIRDYPYLKDILYEPGEYKENNEIIENADTLRTMGEFF